jgi:hypothetical protein
VDNIELIIRNGNTLYYPPLQDNIVWETERKSTPGKLTFSIIPDQTLNIEEGNPVRLKVNDTNVFYGFIFTMSRNKDETLKITAYDQLRYLKNKDTKFFYNMTATQIIEAIAKDFRMNLGNITDTGYVFEKRAEDNSELFSMIQFVLEETTRITGKLYCLYDDFGKLTLKNVEDMKLPLLYDNETIEDFDYKSSIDSNTYNKIKIAFDNKDTGKRDEYVSQSGENINKWGVLQYYNKENENTFTQAKADALLKLYNQKTKTLSLKNAIGDLRVRAGSSIIVKLDLADTNVNRFMLVEKAKHTISNGEYFMDLSLKGGVFNAV